MILAVSCKYNILMKFKFKYTKNFSFIEIGFHVKA